MASSFTSNKLGLELPGNGDYPNNWNTPVNSDFTVIDAAIGGTSSITLTNANVTATSTQAQKFRFLLTGTLTTNVNLIIPATIGGFWVIDNQTTGSFTVTVITAAGGSTGISAPQGFASLVFSDGTNVKLADNGTLLGVNTSTIINALNIYNTSGASNKLRWSMGIDGTTESGANAGSNLILQAYSDTGTLIGTVMTVTRSSKAVAFAAGVSAAGQIFGQQYSSVATYPIISPIADGFFRNLSVTVQTNSTVNISADLFTAFDGTNTMTFRNLNVTATTGSSGAINQMDTGGPGTNRWLQIWAVGRPDTGASGVMITQNASPSPPSPLPSGYSYYARVGSIKVDGSSNLYRSVQRGSEWRWQVTASTNTTAIPSILGNSTGNPLTGTYTQTVVQALTGANPLAVVPPTAKSITVTLSQSQSTGAVTAAPNGNYGTVSSTANPPPLYSYISNVMGTMVLETSSIYLASNSGTSTSVLAVGYTDTVNAS